MMPPICGLDLDDRGRTCALPAGHAGPHLTDLEAFQGPVPLTLPREWVCPQLAMRSWTSPDGRALVVTLLQADRRWTAIGVETEVSRAEVGRG